MVPLQVVEDKTFGLKNKNKSSKVQQYVKTLEKSVDVAKKRLDQSKDEKKVRLYRLAPTASGTYQPGCPCNAIAGLLCHEGMGCMLVMS